MLNSQQYGGWVDYKDVHAGQALSWRQSLSITAALVVRDNATNAYYKLFPHLSCISR